MDNEKEEISEADKPLTKKDLLDYVIKLNEREFAKQQRQGFTIWTLVAALAVLGYKLIEALPQIIVNNNFDNLMFILVMTLNFVLPLVKFIDAMNIFKSDSYSIIEEYNALMHSFPRLIILSFMAHLNLQFFISIQGMSYLKIIFMIFSASYYIVLFSPVIVIFKFIKFKFKHKIKFKISDLNNIRIENFGNNLVSTTIMILILCSYLALSIFAFTLINYTSYINNSIEMIKIAFVLIAFLLILIYTYHQLLLIYSNKHFENVEKILMLFDSTYEELIECIKKCYYSPLNERIIRQNNEIANMNEKVTQLVDELEQYVALPIFEKEIFIEKTNNAYIASNELKEYSRVCLNKIISAIICQSKDERIKVDTELIIGLKNIYDNADCVLHTLKKNERKILND